MNETDIVASVREYLSMDKNRRVRCHVITDEYFHATEPSVAEVNESTVGGTPDMAKVFEMIERHFIVSESSFGWENSAAEMPMHLFGEVITNIITAGKPSKSDGSCHAGFDTQE